MSEADDKLTPGHWRFRREYGDLPAGIGPEEARVLDALAHLHRLEVERFYDRRKLEWRLAFTLWAGLVVAGALALDHVPADAPGIIVWPLAIGFTIMPYLHYVFEREAIVLGAISGRNRGYAMSNAVLVRLGWKPTYPLYPYRTSYAHYSLVGVSAVLAGTVVLLLAAETREYVLLLAPPATVAVLGYLDFLVHLTRNQRSADPPSDDESPSSVR